MPKTAIVIGAGIVGLHVAHVLNEKGYEVFVLEKAPYLAEHTSGRNSGVIHAGIFYPTGSFKEAICLEGNRLTYEWVRRLNVPYKPCGKWVVPEPGQEGQMESFFEKISRLPIPQPRLFSPQELKKEEPCLAPLPAIFIPSTGILDAASYLKALALYLEAKGVTILLNCEVNAVDGQKIGTTRGEMEFDMAVNSAGLMADEMAHLAGLDGYTIRPCRGDYYLTNRVSIKRPVYHLPYQGAHGLGVHLTPTVDDQVLVGPNAFFIDEKENYHHRSEPKAFEKAMQYHLPDQSCKLTKAYSGNRPKLFYKGEPIPEFTLIQKGAWIHLLGIESPGLTSAPALGISVGRMIS